MLIIMHATLAAAVLFLGSCVTARFALQPLHDGLVLERALISENAEVQKPILSGSRGGSGPFTPGNFTLNRQNQTTCVSYGEAQWAGTVDVTDKRRLFFWFSESRNDPHKDPIIIWMNGGPGGSSMLGLFTEMGPCILEVGATETRPNPWAWNNNASVIFLDQPAGTGFSSVAEEDARPAGDLDGAEDFQVFLNIMFQQVFPDKADLPIYLAGESYAGHFVPTYVKHILDARSYRSETAFWGNITSLILINALLDWTAVGVGIHELLCTDYRGRDFISSSACDNLRRALPELERLGQICDLGQDGQQCLATMVFFLQNIDIYYRSLILSGERNMYNIHEKCLQPPICQDLNHGNLTWYLNQEHIKSALGVPSSHNFIDIDLKVGEGYVESGDFFKTATSQLAEILDAHEATRSMADIRVLVLNGNEDYTVNTPGQAWLYDSLRWGGQAEYRIASWSALPYGLGAQGYWKGSPDGRLVFVGLDGAGHAAPGDVGEGSYRVLQKWIVGGW